MTQFPFLVVRCTVSSFVHLFRCSYVPCSFFLCSYVPYFRFGSTLVALEWAAGSQSLRRSSPSHLVPKSNTRECKKKKGVKKIQKNSQKWKLCSFVRGKEKILVLLLFFSNFPGNFIVSVRFLCLTVTFLNFFLKKKFYLYEFVFFDFEFEFVVDRATAFQKKLKKKKKNERKFEEKKIF